MKANQNAKDLAQDTAFNSKIDQFKTAQDMRDKN